MLVLFLPWISLNYSLSLLVTRISRTVLKTSSKGSYHCLFSELRRQNKHLVLNH